MAESRSFTSEDDRRSCWVCFATDEDDRTTAWVKPCKCRGATKWVHQHCLQRWIDEKQGGNSSTKVACPQCGTPYAINFPNLGPLMYVMDTADLIIYKVSPFLAGGIFLGSMYWTAVTYGAVTIMQVLGHKEGLTVMERADPLFLLIGLPTIPVMLILGKMVRWEDYVLRLWRKHSSQLPILHHFFSEELSVIPRAPSALSPTTDPTSATRVLCGALALPTIATIAGKLMFGRIQSNFQRTLLGGIAFIVIKGILKIYYKQQQHTRQMNRIVLDYTPPPTPPTAEPASSQNPTRNLSP